MRFSTVSRPTSCSIISSEGYPACSQWAVGCELSITLTELRPSCEAGSQSQLSLLLEFYIREVEADSQLPTSRLHPTSSRRLDRAALRHSEKQESYTEGAFGSTATCTNQ